MPNLTVFNFKKAEVRVIEKDGEPWFVAADVCSVLDISNATQAINRLDEDERSMFNIGRQGNANIVNEAGLYTLILGSRKSEAKEFKRWITHEVIPSIRKHGTYMTPETIEKVLTDPDTIINIATQLKQERQLRIEAQAKVKELAPIADFGKAICNTDASILIGDFAKVLNSSGIKMGRDRLFKWLQDKKYIYRDADGQLKPYQRYADMELFSVVERTYSTNEHGMKISVTIRVTGKGQKYFYEKLKIKAS